MNESGGPVKALATFYKVPAERIIAIHDELDIAFGTLRTKLGGGDNGHNGLKSMRSSLGTGDFYRVRVGIGRPPGRQSPADFVLSNYTRCRAQGAAAPGRHRRRRRRVAGQRRPRAHPAAVQPLTSVRSRPPQNSAATSRVLRMLAALEAPKTTDSIFGNVAIHSNASFGGIAPEA